MVLLKEIITTLFKNTISALQKDKFVNKRLASAVEPVKSYLHPCLVICKFNQRQSQL